jgi:hypothetical protein
VTSNNTTILTANDIDRLTAQRNYLKWAVQNDKAILAIVTAGVLTNAIVTDNMGLPPEHHHGGRLADHRWRHHLDRHRRAQLRADADHHHRPAVHHQRWAWRRSRTASPAWSARPGSSFQLWIRSSLRRGGADSPPPRRNLGGASVPPF